MLEIIGCSIFIVICLMLASGIVEPKKRKGRNLGGTFVRQTFGYSDGDVGESLVEQFLTEYCQHRDAYMLNNVTLRLKGGGTTQIDHVLISSKGIFVIETKHYSGWIFANPKSRVWTQILYNVKSKFQNPSFQNYKHVRAVHSFFYAYLGRNHIHNIVVFTGEAEFKTEKPKNVLYIEELIPTIDNYSNDHFTSRQIKFCADRLNAVRLEPSYETEMEHHAYLEEKFGR